MALSFAVLRLFTATCPEPHDPNADRCRPEKPKPTSNVLGCSLCSWPIPTIRFVQLSQGTLVLRRLPMQTNTAPNPV
jgi:hypothetical protein